MIVKVKREKTVNGAIPSTVWTDGVFFGYGLENAAAAIPAGRYTVGGKYSEKFRSNKLFLNVPGRSGILFHGANTVDDLKGCIGVGSRRDGGTIAGDLSGKLYEIVDGAAKAGEGVACIVSNPVNWLAVALVAAAVGFVIISRP